VCKERRPSVRLLPHASSLSTFFIFWHFRFSRRQVLRWLSSGLCSVQSGRGYRRFKSHQYYLWDVSELLPDYRA
jgi:hypothetical protein